MTKSTITLLQIIFAVGAVVCRNVDSEKEFTHIGSFKSGVQGRSIDENNYYVSMHPAAWSVAESDCKNIFGNDATLVAIETLEEWDFLRVALESYGGTTFWTGGMYDPSTSVWRWTANNQPLPPFAPWDTGSPAANPHALLRVLLAHTNRYTAAWRTIADSQSHRYICELQRTTIAVPCYRTNDLAIVLDSSGSIGAANYQLALSFIDKLAAAFIVHSASRLAFLIYGNYSVTIINIENTLSPAEISSKIMSTQYLTHNTFTHLGIDGAVAQFSSSPRQVPLNMVVLTDGESFYPPLTVQSANRAINFGVRAFSVGIGHEDIINQQELLTIAGRDSNRVFNTKNFGELIKILAPLSMKICPDE